MTIAHKLRVGFPFVVGFSMVLGLIYYKSTNNKLVIVRTESEISEFLKRKDKKKEEQTDTLK